MSKTADSPTRSALFPLWLTAAFIILLASGCAPAGQPLAATPLPDEFIPTIVAQTAAASIQLSAVAPLPTGTHTPAPVTPSSTATLQLADVPLDLGETATAGTPPSAIEAVDVTAPAVVPELIDEGFSPPTLETDTTLPPAEIKIYRPGDLSRVTSPFSVVANLPPGQNGQVQLELVGEDGRTLANIVQYVIPLSDLSTANLVVDLNFEIPGIAEAGRLQFTLRDANGRLKAVSSVDLVLLSSGLTELKGYGDLRENIVIKQPLDDAVIEGGIVQLSGAARTGDERSLVVELLDRNGKVVGSGLAALDQPLERNFYTFYGEIKYSVTEETPVRLVVRARGARIPGTAFLNSIELILMP